MFSAERAAQQNTGSGIIQRKMMMSNANEAEQQKPANQNLAANYRPLALKAVVAAALMLKRKPAAKVA
jgi:hypothetical protein